MNSNVTCSSSRHSHAQPRQPEAGPQQQTLDPDEDSESKSQKSANDCDRFRRRWYKNILNSGKLLISVLRALSY